MTFDELSLHESILRAVKAEGYSQPTPIQQRAIPHAIVGKDVLGCAQTGTGKTAAFALPILHRLASKQVNGHPLRCLVLTPTRELASQIGDSFATYGKFLPLRYTVIFGGVGQDAQVQALRRGVDILVATPGRLLDLMSQRLVSLQTLEVFVLDEADRMLDMGFIHDVKRVIQALPKQRQTLFFSATMPPDIQALSKSILVDPVRVEVTPVATAAETVEQRLYHVEKNEKRSLLVHVLNDPSIARVLVFTRTKNGANRVARHLEGARIGAGVIHGNKSQNARERALDEFKRGTTRVLVATDIAARGIDIEGITHVINFDVPNVPETYVHRIGRTGRAGASGIALAFCDSEERAYVRDIEKTIRRVIPVVAEHPFKSRGPSAASPQAPAQGNPGGQRPQQGGQPRGQGQGQDGQRRRRRGRGGGGGRPGGGPQRAHEASHSKGGQPRSQGGQQQSRPQNAHSAPPRSSDAAAPAPVRSRYGSKWG